MKSDFLLLHDHFIGVRALADNYGVEGAPAAATNAPGFVFGNGDALHFGGNLQLQPKMLSKVKAELLVENTSGGNAEPNSVPDGTRVFFGLIGDAYNADPLANITKYILFYIEGSGDETNDIYVKASDGVTTVSETTRVSDARSREFEIDLASGVEEIHLRVGGKPAHNPNAHLALKQILDSDRMQPVLGVVGLNCNVTLSQLSIEGRRSLLK